MIKITDKGAKVEIYNSDNGEGVIVDKGTAMKYLSDVEVCGVLLNARQKQKLRKIIEDRTSSLFLI